MERSHRIDDEEFLAQAQRYPWYYDVERPHFGAGMGGKTPMEELRELGLNLPDGFAALGIRTISGVIVVDREDGADSRGNLMARYLRASVATSCYVTPSI